MATPTESIDRPEVQPEDNPPVRRKGPMSPEEMVDVRSRELLVDEAMVRRLVDEAKADYGVNLLEPHQLYVGGWDGINAFVRHRRRFLQVMGAGAKFRTNGKFTVLTLFLAGGIFAGLYMEATHPWGFDLIIALAFGIICGVALRFFGGYGAVFAKLYALERRDFTDPSYVTGWVRVWVARLAFYFRPNVWRGNDGHNGIANPDSVIVVACGLDAIKWTYDEDDPDWDEEVWCEVTSGRPLTDFRSPADYYDLPADTYTVDGVGMKHRRSWCRDLLKSGGAHDVWEKGSLALMQGRWPWIVISGTYGIGALCLMFALG